jgi:hypothetical protein
VNPQWDAMARLSVRDKLGGGNARGHSFYSFLV